MLTASVGIDVRKTLNVEDIGRRSAQIGACHNASYEFGYFGRYNASQHYCHRG